MSDFIRAYGMSMSFNKGNCRKCGAPRDKGNHRKCDSWPGGMGMKTPKGLKYVANTDQTTLEELQNIVAAICAGEDVKNTPIHFEIRVREVFPKEEKPKKQPNDGRVVAYSRPK
jgi:hypothetical protein